MQEGSPAELPEVVSGLRLQGHPLSDVGQTPLHAYNVCPLGIADYNL
jgi:hypothetical protein